MSIPSRKLFLSAVSNELGHDRRILQSILIGPLLEVKEENYFINLGGDTLSMLDKYIATCDGVIHLLGDANGSHPDAINIRDLLERHPDLQSKLSFLPNIAANGQRYSYTQWEAYLAIYYGIDLYLFRPTTDAQRSPNYIRNEAQKTEQEQHRLRLESVGRFGKAYANFDQLAILTLQELVNARFAPFLPEGAKRKVIPNNLPAVGSLFKGRDDFLEKLRSVLLKKSTHIAAGTAKQAIHGLGGVGKTRAAVEYAKRYADEYTALLFITADNEANLKTSLASLCGIMVLNLPEQAAKELEVQVAATIRWLREHSDWFLIVDNVDTPEAATATEELLQKLDNGHVIITSRLSNWGHAVQELVLDVLSEPAAVEMLLERTVDKRKVTPSDDNEALKLAKDLGYLPLALEQAGAFIVEDGCCFADYRKLWEAHDDEVLNWHDQRTMKYPRSVATTWQTSFDKLSDDGRALLQILCWLAPEPIPLTMLEKLSTGEDEVTINISKARRDLARFSFIKWSDATNTALVVHRLVQEITEYRLPEAEKLGWLKRSLQMVNDFCVGDPSDVRSWPEIYIPARPHLTAITATADKAKIADPTARLMGCLALYHFTRSYTTEAELLLRRALAIVEISFGNDHPEVASHLNNLASLLQETNRLAEAEPLLRRALAISEISFGNDHPDFAILLNNLGHLLQETNRLAEAEPLMRQAVAIDKTSFGNDHPNVARDLNNLGHLLQETNRLAEAEPLKRRALAISETSFGNDHPNVARDLNSLAHLLQETNRFAEAEPLMRRALAIDEISFGNDHPKIAIRLNNLAMLLQETNRLAEAEPLIRRALAIDETSFSKDHPNVARGLNNLATLLQETNRLAEAEPLMRRALAIDESSFGPDHPNVAIKLNSLARLLHETNRLAEAEPLMRRALAIDESSFGPDHPNVAIRLNSLARLLHETNRLAEAEPLVRRSLAIDEKSFGKDHPRVAVSLNNLAQVLKTTNRLAEAEPLMRRALAISESSFGKDHPSVAVRLNNLSSLLQTTNRLVEAEPLMRRALAINEQSFGPDHPNAAISLNNLSLLLHKMNRLAEAEPLMRRALAINEQSFGPDHPNVAMYLSNLAQILKATNRLADADVLMRRNIALFVLFQFHTGHRHSEFESAIQNYYSLLDVMGHNKTEFKHAVRQIAEEALERIGQT